MCERDLPREKFERGLEADERVVALKVEAMVPWTTKHRPKHLDEVVGNRPTIERVQAWLRSWGKELPRKRAILLYGPPGTGKTVTVEALANDEGWDLVEINASDKRTGELLEKIAGTAATEGGLFRRGRIVLLDEVDGINLREDRGAVSAIASIAKTARHPVVLTANNPWDPRIRPLRDVCELVQLKRLGVRDSLPYLRKLAAEEHVEVDEQALRTIFDRNKGDMRGCVNDLEMLSAGRKRVSAREAEWLTRRDRAETVFDAVRAVFYATNAQWARRAIDISDVDYEMLFEWVYENAPMMVKTKADLSNVMEALAQADLYKGRIAKTQAWHLLSYHLDLMTAGVALAKDGVKPGFLLPRFPRRVNLLSRTMGSRAVRASLGTKIGAKCHVSSHKALTEYLPYVLAIRDSGSDEAESVTSWFGFDEKEQSYLQGPDAESAENEE